MSEETKILLRILFYARATLEAQRVFLSVNNPDQLRGFDKTFYRTYGNLLRSHGLPEEAASVDLTDILTQILGPDFRQHS